MRRIPNVPRTLIPPSGRCARGGSRRSLTLEQRARRISFLANVAGTTRGYQYTARRVYTGIYRERGVLAECDIVMRWCRDRDLGDAVVPAHPRYTTCNRAGRYCERSVTREQAARPSCNQARWNPDDARAEEGNLCLSALSWDLTRRRI